MEINTFGVANGVYILIKDDNSTNLTKIEREETKELIRTLAMLIELSTHSDSKDINVKKREWTDWEYGEKFTIGIRTYIPMYRNNGRVVECKTTNNKNGKTIKARSTCHPSDKFNLENGKTLALMRLKTKIMEEKARRYADSL